MFERCPSSVLFEHWTLLASFVTTVCTFLCTKIPSVGDDDQLSWCFSLAVTDILPILWIILKTLILSYEIRQRQSEKLTNYGHW